MNLKFWTKEFWSNLWAWLKPKLSLVFKDMWVALVNAITTHFKSEPKDENNDMA